MAIDALRTTQNPYSQYDGGASVMNQVIGGNYQPQQQFTGGQNVMQNYLSGVGAGNQIPINFNTGGQINNQLMGAYPQAIPQSTPGNNPFGGIEKSLSDINWGEVAKVLGSVIMYGAL